jgi:hypothetical protein
MKTQPKQACDLNRENSPSFSAFALASQLQFNFTNIHVQNEPLVKPRAILARVLNTAITADINAMEGIARWARESAV